MPTVPPTYVPIAAYDEDVPPVPGAAAFPVSAFLDRDRDDAAAGPTPDPDLDDFAFVPMESGNAVTETGPDRPPALSFPFPPRTSRSPSPSHTPPPARKPRLSLGALSLHSPSALVGTPFDLSPRFEYPFPASASASAADADAHYPYPYPCAPGWAGFPVSTSLPNLAVGPAFAYGHPHPPWGPGLPMGMGVGAAQSSIHAHPKMRVREPPVPPGLVKKRRLMREREREQERERERERQREASARRAASMGSVDGGGAVDDRTPMPMLEERRPSAPLPLRPTLDTDSVPRRADLDRRESDETVVGGPRERGGERGGGCGEAEDAEVVGAVDRVDADAERGGVDVPRGVVRTVGEAVNAVGYPGIPTHDGTDAREGVSSHTLPSDLMPAPAFPDIHAPLDSLLPPPTDIDIPAADTTNADVAVPMIPYPTPALPSRHEQIHESYDTARDTTHTLSERDIHDSAYDPAPELKTPEVAAPIHDGARPLGELRFPAASEQLDGPRKVLA
ncbi:uncharacterized protein C8Q71DRAFT_530988 [Rhodofomes roseus]|uniref:Uncharacterized protein n=1 Tax=Rhodofomes roseus TaxID=34475 RepID=A0ABQ8KJY0_9APHY|nr:uncharacterized protein C8Q71DRAFT_530988 [Rhodofomes roseus]KAH9838449.1 hypothetical protein C8Q71DRAFT_530988 [Rhodofomes roseus]